MKRVPQHLNTDIIGSAISANKLHLLSRNTHDSDTFIVSIACACECVYKRLDGTCLQLTKHTLPFRRRSDSRESMTMKTSGLSSGHNTFPFHKQYICLHAYVQYLLNGFRSKSVSYHFILDPFLLWAWKLR